MFYLALVEQLLSIVKQICAGYLGYPFQNKQVKSFVENLARDVEKEEKIRVVVIISTFLWNGYPKLASTVIAGPLYVIVSKIAE